MHARLCLRVSVEGSYDILDMVQGMQGSFLPGDSPTLRFSSNSDQFSRLPGGMRVVSLPCSGRLYPVTRLSSPESVQEEHISQAESAGLLLLLLKPAILAYARTLWVSWVEPFSTARAG